MPTNILIVAFDLFAIAKEDIVRAKFVSIRITYNLFTIYSICE